MGVRRLTGRWFLARLEFRSPARGYSRAHVSSLVLSLRCGLSKLNDVLCRVRRKDGEPFFRLGLGRQPLVMGVNHRGGISGCRGGQVLVAVQSKMETAKSMAQPVAAGWDFERLAQSRERAHIAIQRCGLPM